MEFSQHDRELEMLQDVVTKITRCYQFYVDFRKSQEPLELGGIFISQGLYIVTVPTFPSCSSVLYFHHFLICSKIDKALSSWVKALTRFQVSCIRSALTSMVLSFFLYRV